MEKEIRMTNFANFSGTIAMKATSIRVIVKFFTLSIRERENKFKLIVDEPDKLD